MDLIERVLKYAVLAEFPSKHPIAQAIKNFYEVQEDIDRGQIRNYMEIAGYGVKARIGDLPVLVGNGLRMKFRKVDVKVT